MAALLRCRVRAGSRHPVTPSYPSGRCPEAQGALSEADSPVGFRYRWLTGEVSPGEMGRVGRSRLYCSPESGRSHSRGPVEGVVPPQVAVTGHCEGQGLPVLLAPPWASPQEVGMAVGEASKAGRSLGL